MLNSFGVGLGVALPLGTVLRPDRVGLLVGGYWVGGEATTLPRGHIAGGKLGKTFVDRITHGVNRNKKRSARRFQGAFKLSGRLKIMKSLTGVFPRSGIPRGVGGGPGGEETVGLYPPRVGRVGGGLGGEWEGSQTPPGPPQSP